MTIAVDTITATLLEGAGHDLGKVSGSVTMDEGWAPHVQATLVLGIPDEALLDLLDPRDARRVLIEVSQTFPNSFIADEARSFDLALRERVIDHEAGTITLTLMSDEALLMDDLLVADAADTSALAYQSSLRDIIDNVVLSRIGATLEAGADDAPFRVLTDSTNLIPNPNFTLNNSGWGPGGFVTTTGTMSNPASGGVENGPYSRFTANATTSGTPTAGGIGSGVYADLVTSVGGWTIGGIYSFSLYGRSSKAMPLAISVEFRTASSAISNHVAASFTSAANTWQRYTFENLTVPVGTTVVRLRFTSINDTGYSAWTSGNTLDIDWVMANPGATVTDYFDGAFADTTEYGYAWEGTAHGSVSTRLALIDRSPDLLRWDPGESAWDFIQPLFQAAGFRLYCDEARNWHLVSGSDYIAPGMTQLTFGVHLTRAQDGISRDSDEWFDAAVVTYRWRDSDGAEQERVDHHAAPGSSKARAFVVERPYPGPGFAQYAVKRATGKGRTLRLATMNRLGVTPSQILRVELPNTLTQLGVVASVTWDLSEAVMAVSSRGLTDTPEGAWALADPGMTWGEAPATTTWNDWINPNGV